MADNGQRTIPNRPPKRPLATTLTLLALWVAFYASFTLFRPALLDDADSVHAEVAREMLLRHDWVTLYANGIRYLEKAPLLYWTMAASMRVAQALGHGSPQCLAVAARIPLALTVLALAFAVESFTRRAFSNPGRSQTGARAGLYAGLILLSSPGIFLYTRILLPDAMLCLWLTLALYSFWLTEPRRCGPILGLPAPHSSGCDEWQGANRRLSCHAFAACCALGVLTKGLIGLVFPVTIVALYLLLTRGLRGAVTRIGQLHPITSTAVFLAIAAPWHILIALANPTQGHPGGLAFHLHGSPHWQVPLPTNGNVHGWAWFYFVNEQVLRYLNLRVPHDYDTVPLWLFWGLILLWLMPWSAFLPKVFIISHRHKSALKSLGDICRDLRDNRRHGWAAPDSYLLALLAIWTAVPLLFFSLSTRQEYYVLPALPALAMLIANWLDWDWSRGLGGSYPKIWMREANLRWTLAPLAFGVIFAAAALWFLLHTHKPSPGTDLATLLQQNPSDYAMSMGHFLDLNAQALGLFRLPLGLAAASLFLGPLASLILRKKAKPHAATLALAGGAFGFLLAAHLGLQTFAPVLSSAQLAEAIRPQLARDPGALIIIHQEYEYGSTLGFYLQRPGYDFAGLLGRAVQPGVRPTAPTPAERASFQWRAVAVNPIHILTDAGYHAAEQVPGSPYGRSSNLWYGSFFPDAPEIFETPASLAAKWRGPQRIFVWQSLDNQPSPLPAELTPAYVIARSGGKEIVSNRPDR